MMKKYFKVIRLEFVDQSVSPVNPNRALYHSIIFATKGASVFSIDLKEYELKGNQILIVPQGAIWQKGETDQLHGYEIRFSNDFFSHVQALLLNGLFLKLVLERQLSISVVEAEKKTLALYFQLLYDEQSNGHCQNQTFLLQNLMLSLLNKIEGYTFASAENQHDNPFIDNRIFFQKLISLIEDHFRKQHSSKFYLDQLQINSKKLNGIAKSMIGKTVSQLILERIMLEAKRELCFSENSIKTIAIALGYENQYYFSRIFKKKILHTPEEFRKLFAE